MSNENGILKKKRINLPFLAFILIFATYGMIYITLMNIFVIPFDIRDMIPMIFGGIFVITMYIFWKIATKEN